MTLPDSLAANRDKTIAVAKATGKSATVWLGLALIIIGQFSAATDAINQTLNLVWPGNHGPQLAVASVILTRLYGIIVTAKAAFERDQ